MDPTLGKVMAALGTIAFVVQMSRLTLRWWGNRRRQRMLAARRSVAAVSNRPNGVSQRPT
ncbi:MAG: hypothetical protein EXR79_01015 [Myxococcales bacterium]|nr:hypothetical protein [Myxococcales bacterium]